MTDQLKLFMMTCIYHCSSQKYCDACIWFYLQVKTLSTLFHTVWCVVCCLYRWMIRILIVRELHFSLFAVSFGWILFPVCCFQSFHLNFAVLFLPFCYFITVSTVSLYFESSLFSIEIRFNCCLTLFSLFCFLFLSFVILIRTSFWL